MGFLPIGSKKLNILLLGLLLALGSIPSLAAANITWTGGNGNWSDTAHWVGGVLPTGIDTAIINTGVTITFTADFTNTNLTLDLRGPAPITFNLNNHDFVLGTIVAGETTPTQPMNWFINGHGTITTNVLNNNEDQNNIIAFSNDAHMEVLTNAWFDQNAGTVTTFLGDGTCSINLTGAVGASSGGPRVVFDNITVIGGISYSFSASPTPVAGGTVTVTITAAPLNMLVGSVFKYSVQVIDNNATTNESYTIAGTPFNASSGTIQYLPATTVAGTFSFPIVYPGVIDAADGVNITVYDPSLIPVGQINFTLASTTWTGSAAPGDRSWTNGANWSAGVPGPTAVVVIPTGLAANKYPVLTAAVTTGKITIEAGASLDLNGQNVNGISRLENLGTLRLAGTETIAGTRSNGPVSTVNYYGTGGNNWGPTYSNLVIEATASITATTGLTVNGLNVAGTLNTGNNALTVSGTTTNTGTITLGTALATFNGAVSGAGTISFGTGGITFAADYTGGILNGAAAGPITFQGNTTLGTFGASASAISFAGSAIAQTFNSNGQTLGAITITKGAGNQLQVTGVLTANSLTVTTGTLVISNTLTLTNDLQIDDRLTLNAGAAINARNFTSTGTVDNNVAVAYTLSGNCAISGTCTNPGNIALTMTGASSTIDTTFTLGSLVVGNTISLLSDLNLAGNLTINALANLDVSANRSITLGGNWINNEGIGGFNKRAGTVTLTPNTNHSLSGTTYFHSLTSSNTSATTLTFLAGSTFRFSGTLALNGAVGQLLSLQSSANGSAWNIQVDVNQSGTLAYLRVRDGQVVNNTTTLTATNSSYMGAITDRVVDGDGAWLGLLATAFTWQGVVVGFETEWQQSGNWDQNAIPNGDDVIIPTGLSNYPILDMSRTVNDISILGTASLDILAFTLTVNGTLTNTATIYRRGGGLINVAGTNNDTGTTIYRNVGGTIQSNLSADYNNLQLQGAFTYTTGSSLEVSGTLTLAAASTVLDLGANDLSVTSTVSNTGIIELDGSQTVTLTAGNDTAKGTWRYNGAAGGSIKNFAANDYYNLVVNSSGQIFTTASPIQALGTLTVTAGTINAGANLTAAIVSNGGIIGVVANNLSFGSYSGAGTVTVNGGTVSTSGTGGTIATLTVGVSGTTIGGGATGIVISSVISNAITTTGLVTLRGTGISTLAVNSGTLTANGAITCAGAITFGNPATLNMAGYTLTLGANLTLGVGASLTLSNGTLTGGTRDITVSGGALSATGTASVSTTGAFGVSAGTVQVGTNTFTVGVMTVSGTGSFTQTGANSPAGNQTMTSLTVSGTGSMTWDSAGDYGDLVITGNLTNSATLNFNNKNVSFGGNLTGTIFLLDLIIPNGRNLNRQAASNLTVLRHLTIQDGGQYTHNSRPLTLGGGSINNGNLQDQNTATLQNLGVVTLANGGAATTKTMIDELLMNSLTIGPNVNLAVSDRNLTVTGNISGGGTLTATAAVSASEQIRVGGDFTIAAFSAGNSRVIFNGANAALINSPAGSYNFYELEMAKTAGINLTASENFAVSNSLTLSSGTFVAGAYTHTIAGDWDSDATDVNLTMTGSTIVLSTDTAQITTKAGQNFNNLTLRYGAALQTDLAIAGNLIVASTGAGTLDDSAGPGHTLSVGGNLTMTVANSAAYSYNTTSLLNLNGTGNQTIITNAVNWNDLTITSAHGAGDTVTFTGALNIADTLTVLAGAYDIAINDGGLISTSTSFANTGSLTLNTAAAETLTFTNGIIATAPSGISVAGTIAATAGASAITLGDADTAVTTTANTTIGGTATGTIDIGDLSIASSTLLTVGTGIANTINFDAIAGTAASGNLTINTTGLVTVAGVVGTNIGTITISQSNGVSFNANVTATTLTITDTTDDEDILFANGQAISLGTLTTTSQGYDVVINSTTFNVTTVTNFAHTGILTLGNGAGDTLTFTGGLDTTAVGSTVSAAGTINTTNNPMFIGPVTLTAATTFDTGGATSGSLSVGIVSSGGNALTLDSGTGATATMSLTSMANLAGGLTIRDAGGLATIGVLGSGSSGLVTISQSQAGVTFTGNVSATTFTITDTANGADITFANGQTVAIATLTTQNQGYDVVINSGIFNVTADTNFINSGTVILGNGAGDVLTFAGGLATAGNASNPALVNAAGTIKTTNNRMDIGAVTLTAATNLDTGGTAAAILNVGAVTSGGFSLTLDSGSTAGATMSLTSMANLAAGLTIVDAGGLAQIGTLGSGTAGPVTITQSQAGVNFTGNVNASTLMITDTTNGADITFANGQTVVISTLNTTNQGYDVDFQSTSLTVTNNASFDNTGGLSLGNADADVLIFNGGLTHTAGPTSLHGTVNTSNDDFIVASLTSNGTSRIDTDTALGNIQINGNYTANAATDILQLAAGTGIIDYRGATPLTAPDYWEIVSASQIRNGAGAIINLGNLSVYLNAPGSNIALGGRLDLNNFYVYNGTIDLNAQEIRVSNDAVFIGATYNSNDIFRTLGGATEFAYTGSLALSIPAGRTGALANGVAGGRLKVGRNFYANGANLAAATAWELWLTDKSSISDLSVVNTLSTGLGSGGSSTTDYAVAVAATVSNSTVRRFATTDWTVSTGSEYVNAAEAPSVDAGSAANGWVISRPEISSARTIYDDIIEVVFGNGTVDIALENGNNEITRLVNQTNGAADSAIERALNLRFHDGSDSDYRFLGVFVWDDSGDGIWAAGETGTFVTVATAYPSTDIPAGTRLYFKTATSAASYGAFRWNTDATGASAGAAGSTDRSGAHQTLIARLILQKGRIFAADGKTMNQNFGDDGSATYVATAFTGTTDGCRPVLVGAFLGTHSEAADSAAVADPYNRHNVLHLRYSEALDLSTVSGTEYSAVANPAPTDLDSAVNANAAIFRSRYGAIAAEQFASFKPGASGVTIAGLNLRYGNASTIFNYGARAHATLAPDPTALPSEWTEGIHLIYRGAAATAENPAGAHGLSIFMAGFSVINGTNRYWPGYLGNPADGSADNTLPSGTLTQLDSAYVRDIATLSVEPSSSTYPGLAVVTISNNASGAVTLADVGSGGGGLTTGFTNSWDTVAPLVEVDGAFRRIYTSLNVSNQLQALHFVMSEAIRDTAWAFPSVGAEPQNYRNELDSFSFNAFGEGTAINTYNDSMNTIASIPATIPPYTPTSYPLANDQYFQVGINGSPWGAISSMEVRYNATYQDALVRGAYMTDLAGNLMKSTGTAPWSAYERTPPNVQYSLAAVNGRRVYVHFDEPVFREPALATTSYRDLNAADFVITDGVTNWVPTGLTVVDSEVVAISGQGDRVGVTTVYLDLPLGLTITPDRLYTLQIKAADSNTGDPNRGSIIDKGSTPMQTNRLYRYTNVAIGTASPVSASNDLVNLATGSGVDLLRRFDGSGYLPGGGPIILQVRNSDFANNAYETAPMTMYYDAAVPDSVRALNGLYWSPELLPSFVSQANTEARVLNGISTVTGLHNFTINGDAEFKTNATVEFILRQGDLNLGWVSDLNQPHLVKTWSFHYGAVINQRAGVSILNNVINPNTNDRAILQYTLNSAGSVNIIVTTIDGNVVRVLQRGQQAIGEYRVSWDGRNSGGDTVARGLYLVRIVGPGIDEYRKILVVK